MSFDRNSDRRLSINTTSENLTFLDTPIKGRIAHSIAHFHPTPGASIIDSQALFGHAFRIVAEPKDNNYRRLYVQNSIDSYVGFIDKDAIEETTQKPTHHVIKPRSFLYSEPDMKKAISFPLSLGSHLVVLGEATTRGLEYVATKHGWLVQDHVAPIDQCEADPVTVAETLIHTPYLWGGTSAFGIDCSGLVQLCHAMCGNQVLRDTDMQAATIGSEISGDSLQRGDLVFWKGHVAMMRDEKTIVHANGHTMDVAIEPLDEAVARIAHLYGQPTLFKRP